MTAVCDPGRAVCPSSPDLACDDCSCLAKGETVLHPSRRPRHSESLVQGQGRAGRGLPTSTPHFLLTGKQALLAVLSRGVGVGVLLWRLECSHFERRDKNIRGLGFRVDEFFSYQLQISFRFVAVVLLFPASALHPSEFLGSRQLEA